MPRSIIKQLLGESQQDMRFDLNARVEVWVTIEDLESDLRIQDIRQSKEAPEAKIAAAKRIAQEIAQEKLSSASSSGIEITADFGPESANLDRVIWTDLVVQQVDPDDPDDEFPPEPYRPT
jgi:hypothetical protein